MFRRRNFPKFNALEILLVSCGLTLFWWVVSTTRFQVVPSPEAAILRDAFGPDRFSEHAEEWIVRDYFGDRRAGVFLDVGANHYMDFSNTYFLEQELGWRGIAVEPLTEFAADYATYRPNTTFRAFFVSDVSDEQAKLFVQAGNSLVSSGDEQFNARFGFGRNSTAIDVPTITLNDLLDRERVETIDFLSMDIELWEPKALQGFDIERFSPELVCIEARPEVRQQILDYFFDHGYVLEGRYLRADIWNLYFTPRGGMADVAPTRQ